MVTTFSRDGEYITAITKKMKYQNEFCLKVFGRTLLTMQI
jgi:hypothetical protein